MNNIVLHALSFYILLEASTNNVTRCFLYKYWPVSELDHLNAESC